MRPQPLAVDAFRFDCLGVQNVCTKKNRLSVRKARCRKESHVHEWQSQSHIRWEGKYHVLIVSMYRKKLLYGKLTNPVEPILEALCRQSS